jgi:hypothetical protein
MSADEALALADELLAQDRFTIAKRLLNLEYEAEKRGREDMQQIAIEVIHAG